ncbi:MAG: phosphatidylserine decarboxylase family protein [Ignavibacteriales bacterium]|nr:phosphatidylserine decarboxylase family protein [Ignavibacteriales bacterium]
MITKYGFSVVIKYSVIAIVILFFTLTWVEIEFLRWLLTIIVIVFTLFVINFFRDPERLPPSDKNVVVSPADGKVVLIKNVFEGEYFNKEAIQVSVFMSPFNVHVNRFPISGKIGYFKYIKGKYLVAFEEKSSEVNERTHIGIEQQKFKILFKQIAGTVARRIVAPIVVGQEAKIGERFGMIHFGSRVDVIVPPIFDIMVKLGDKVKAGESVIARIPETAQGISS